MNKRTERTSPLTTSKGKMNETRKADFEIDSKRLRTSGPSKISPFETDRPRDENLEAIFDHRRWSTLSCHRDSRLDREVEEQKDANKCCGKCADRVNVMGFRQRMIYSTAVLLVSTQLMLVLSNTIQTVSANPAVAQIPVVSTTGNFSWCTIFFGLHYQHDLAYFFFLVLEFVFNVLSLNNGWWTCLCLKLSLI
jgi:hypothetical protein